MPIATLRLNSLVFSNLSARLGTEMQVLSKLPLAHHTFVQVMAKRDDSGLVKLGFSNDQLPGEQSNVRQVQAYP
jgi:hypothetical protein